MARTEHRKDNEDRPSWNARMMQVGWSFSIFGGLLLIVFVIGLFLNWFDVDGIANDEQIGLAVAVNTDDVAKSADAVKESVAQTSESAEVMAETEVVDGLLLSVGRNGEDYRLNVKPKEGDNKSDEAKIAPLEIKVGEHTTFEGEATEVQELTEESPVRIVYRESEKGMFAINVKVFDKSETKDVAEPNGDE